MAQKQPQGIAVVATPTNVAVLPVVITKPFIPPSFRKIGKDYDELFTRNFLFSAHRLTLSTLHQNDIQVINTGTLNGKGDVTGTVTGIYSPPAWGSLTTSVSVNRNGTGSATAAAVLDTLYPGLVMRLTATDVPRHSVELEYSRPHLSAGVEFERSATSTNMILSGVLGAAGISVGDEFTYNINNNKLLDWSVGAQYSGSMFTAAVKTREKFKWFDFSLLSPVATPGTAPMFLRGLQLGAHATYEHPDVWRFGAVASYALDRLTTLKYRVSSDGSSAAVFEQRSVQFPVTVRISALMGRPMHIDRLGVGLFFTAEGWIEPEEWYKQDYSGREFRSWR